VVVVVVDSSGGRVVVVVALPTRPPAIRQAGRQAGRVAEDLYLMRAY
jgi:hypothetical protein